MCAFGCVWVRFFLGGGGAYAAIPYRDETSAELNAEDI